MTNHKIDTALTDSMSIDIYLDKNKTTVLNDIITTCKQKKIKLIFIQSPIYVINRNGYYNSVFSELCAENDVSYINLSSQPIFNNHPDDFEDKSHLNDVGAKVFSNMVINKIKQTQF